MVAMTGRKQGAWGRESTFWNRIDKSGGPDSCWPLRTDLGYGSHRNPQGYGYANWQGRQTLAHRVAWLYAHPGEAIPPGLVVRHTCDNPPCCNPAHLILGTNADNTADMMSRNRDYWSRRTHCKHGHDLAIHGRIATRANGKSYRRCMACRREQGN